MRLAIRDSMFRLSKSAIGRHSVTNRSNTSSSVEIQATVDEESEYKHRYAFPLLQIHCTCSEDSLKKVCFNDLSQNILAVFFCHR